MGGIPAPLSYLLIGCGLTTAVLAILVIYGGTLSDREDDQLYLNKAEESMMASEQRVLIGKMERLKKVIMVLAVIAGVLVLASAGVWLWTGLTR
ncbi:MAG: hypothetical protein ABSE45_08530 [Candidatus Acidiferrales bacterium]|jgi:hypothetical protein